MIVLSPRQFPRRIGTWTATWQVADRSLATQRVRAIAQRTFQRSLPRVGHALRHSKRQG